MKKEKPKCEYCKTNLRESKDDEGKFLYCPNEMCLNEKEVKI